MSNTPNKNNLRCPPATRDAGRVRRIAPGAEDTEVPAYVDEQEVQRPLRGDARGAVHVRIVNSQRNEQRERLSREYPRREAVPIVEPEPTTRYSSRALENEAQLKEGNGVLWEVTVVVTSNVASARFLHLYDKVGELTAGDIPFFRLPIPAGPSSVTFTPVGGRTFVKGLRAATSSTLATFTDPGDTEATFHGDMD